MSSLDWAALRQGGAVALVVAVPCSIAATWLGSQEDDSAWTILFVLGALAGFTLGAGIAAWVQRTGYPLLHGIVCAGGTYLVAQAVFVTVRLARGDDVRWLAVLFNLTASVFAGVLGGGMGSALQKRGFVPSTGRVQQGDTE